MRTFSVEWTIGNGRSKEVLGSIISDKILDQRYFDLFDLRESKEELKRRAELVFRSAELLAEAGANIRVVRGSTVADKVRERVAGLMDGTKGETR